MQSAAATLEAAGIESEAMLGDADPIVAVQEAWNPGRYDEVVVSTLAVGSSRWLQVDLPHRVAKLTDCQVRHVAVPARRPAPARPQPRPSAGRCSSAWPRSCARDRGRAPPERRCTRYRALSSCFNRV